MIHRTWLLAAAPLALAGCMTSTGDTAMLSAGQTSPITQAERQQGTAANAGIVAEFGGAYTGPQSAYIERIGQKVAVQSGLSTNAGAFDVTTLNSAVNNAFAVPGGYIYVTRQLVALMNDEAELAAVLGHEVAHVAARHSAQRQSVAQRNSILGALGQAIVGAVAGNSGLAGLASRGIGTGAQLATLGYSRGQETQSDDLGIAYLTRASYDPSALSTMLESLAAQNALDQRIRGDARSMPAWASTHPDPGARVQRAAQRAQAEGVTGGLRNRDAFLAAIDGMPYGDDPAQGVIQGQSFLYPTGRVAFTVPQGFTMQNSAKAVSISGPNAQAQFATARYDGNIERYVQTVLGGLSGNGTTPAATVRRTTIGGMPAGIASVRANSGSGAVDATIVAYAPSNAQAYHFVILAPAGQGVGALEPMVESFRRMSTADAAAVKSRRLRVVTVGATDTVAGLANRMAFDDQKLERFLVLNRLSANARLRAGEKVKIVTY